MRPSRAHGSVTDTGPVTTFTGSPRGQRCLVPTNSGVGRQSHWVAAEYAVLHEAQRDMARLREERDTA
jgi:hypothetical protein